MSSAVPAGAAWWPQYFNALPSSSDTFPPWRSSFSAPAVRRLRDDAKILVDCGSGVTQRLVAAGTPGRALDALLLTHLHSDHLVDLYQLIVSSWTAWRDRPLPVFGPPGTKRYVKGLMALWEPELSLRIAHEQRPSTAALETEVTEVSPGQTLTFGSTSVDVIEVDHQPVRHALGFLFRSGGLTPAFSVDLVPSTCWYSNVRSHVPKAAWDRVRRPQSRVLHRGRGCGTTNGPAKEEIPT